MTPIGSVSQPVRVNGQNVTLLGLIAPDFHRRHGRIGTGYLAKLQGTAMATIILQMPNDMLPIFAR